MGPLKVYLCDLTHETVILVSDTIPVNIGYIGSYARRVHGDAVDVSLFKYPSRAIEAIKSDPPDVLALSNYSWNSNLAERTAAIAKAVNHQVVTVLGGPNFPHTADQRLAYLLERPNTDIHTEFEGEVAFANVLGRVLEARDGGGPVLDAPIDGCVFVHPSSRREAEPKLIQGMRPPRIQNLDDIPSPYLSGMLDPFFDGRLSPFIETNRGCPFKCSFCHTGNDYFQKMNMFSLDRIRAELRYAAERAAERKNTVLHIADTNFGMFPRDREICEALYDLQQEYGWPLNVVSTTGKNNKERVIDITGILGNMFPVTMSVQSMDDAVLANIKRSNIKLDHYIAVNTHLKEQGRSTTGEMILGLPGETKESFMRGVEQVVEAGVSRVTIYTLMMLYGTEFKDPDYRKTYEMEGKFRIVPLNFGDYDGERVFDYEEVCIQTRDMSFEDYLELRCLALMVETVHNDRTFEEFFRYALALGRRRSELLFRIFRGLDQAPAALRRVVDGFMEETRGELWESPEAMRAHYSKDENYQRLAQGKVGGNLIYKYKSMSLATAMPAWIEYLTGLLKDMVAEDDAADAAGVAAAQREIDALAEFCRCKIWKFLDADADDTRATIDSDYDFVAWLKDPEGAPLADYRSDAPIRYRFEFTDEQIRARRDKFRRYGTDVNALSKIVTRLVVESLFRTVTRDADPDSEYGKKVERGRTRYALSN